jgi:3-hydroxybutyryl-CoA dehydrogenase
MIKKIGIVGAGTMGSGIAQLFIQKNYPVILIDRHEDVIARAEKKINLGISILEKKNLIKDKIKVLSNLSVLTNITSLKTSDLVIEAVAEDLEIKKNVFRSLDKVCNKKAIFATNTSSLSVTEISKSTSRQDKFIGMHFFNPVAIMKLVEIARGKKTSDSTFRQIKLLSGKLGKTVVESKDSPGFISNRLLFVMINEAIYALRENISTKEGIDTAMKLGAAHPMGPLELADYIGLDITFDILNILYKRTNDRKFKPCPLLSEMVRKGRIGRKSGRGFYDYKVQG